MNLTEIQLNIKARAFSHIFTWLWFDAFQLDAHDVILKSKILFPMLKSHVQFWQIEGNLLKK